ncbi:sodium-independent sulfate anion transporter-like isoform X2 [Ptychodera flava]
MDTHGSGPADPLVQIFPDPVLGSLTAPDSTQTMSFKEEVGDFCRKSCTVKNWKKKLPITLWAPKYKPSFLLSDIIAGLTVGLTVIPQGLAYAVVAQLPVQYGLYSAFMGCFVYCLLGTSKDITLGPTAIMSLMVSIFAGPVDENNLHDPLYAVALTFISGCIQLVMGLLYLGFLVNFISFPVITGFTTAAAITIACGQIKHVLGLSYHADTFIDDIKNIIKLIPETNYWDFIMATCCFIALFALKFLKSSAVKWEENADDETIPVWRKIIWKTFWLLGTARNAVVVIIAGVLAWSLRETDKKPLTLVGEIPAGLPDFRPPAFSDPSKNVTTSDIFQDLNAGIIVVPLVGFLESIAIAKAFARQNQYKVDPNQELVALGGANILSSFVSSYPITGSFSRTAVNSQSGVKTQFGGVFTGSLVLLALAFLTETFRFIPMAALAAVIISAVLQMVECRIILRLWKLCKLDLFPWFVTLVFSLTLGIEIGIGIGIAVDILVVLYKTAKPKVQAVNREILVLKLSHGVHYPAVEHITTSVLEKGLEQNKDDDDEERENLLPKAVILDCSHMYTVDYTTVQGMTELIYEYKRAGVRLVFAGLEPSIGEVFKQADISGFTSHSTVDNAISSLVDTPSLIVSEENWADDAIGAAVDKLSFARNTVQ